MGLDAIKEERLKRASFVSEFGGSRKTSYVKLAKEAYAYAKNISTSPKPDDVAPPLEQALRSNGRFLDVMANKKKSARYWYRDFADLIIDSAWSEIRKGG